MNVVSLVEVQRMTLCPSPLYFKFVQVLPLFYRSSIVNVHGQSPFSVVSEGHSDPAPVHVCDVPNSESGIFLLDQGTR